MSLTNFRRSPPTQPYRPVNWQRMSDYAKGLAQAVAKAKPGGPNQVSSGMYRKAFGPNKTSKVLTTRANGRSYAGGNDFTTTKRTIRPRKPKTNRAKIARNSMLLKSMMQNEIYRFQNITNYDTNVGGLTLRNSRNTTTGAVTTPIHIYDISAFNNESTQTCGYQMGWASTAAGAAFTRTALTGQDQTGTPFSAYWVTEKNATDTPFPAVQNAMHNWTDIRFNFYGPRKRTTYFDVMFIVIKSQYADLLQGNGANVSSKLLLQYLERPLIYSNLQTDVGGEGAKMFKVVKRFRYYVSASQTTDTDTSVGKIKEAKIFMKHDRKRDYDWQHHGLADTDVLPHDDDDGLNYVRDDDVHNFPAYDKRMYMVVKAFSPERAIVTDAAPDIDATRDPTYDVMIRNSFSFVRSTNS